MVATAEVNLVNQVNTKHSNSPNNTSKSPGFAVTPCDVSCVFLFSCVDRLHDHSLLCTSRETFATSQPAIVAKLG